MKLKTLLVTGALLGAIPVCAQQKEPHLFDLDDQRAPLTSSIVPLYGFNEMPSWIPKTERPLFRMHWNEFRDMIADRCEEFEINTLPEILDTHERLSSVFEPINEQDINLHIQRNSYLDGVQRRALRHNLKMAIKSSYKAILEKYSGLTPLEPSKDSPKKRVAPSPAYRMPVVVPPMCLDVPSDYKPSFAQSPLGADDHASSTKEVKRRSPTVSFATPRSPAELLSEFVAARSKALAPKPEDHRK